METALSLLYAEFYRLLVNSGIEMLIFIVIFIALGVIVRTYQYVDKNEINKIDLFKALFFAAISLICIILHETYFALPDGAMVSQEYINYRYYLLWGFLIFMAYIVRFTIYCAVYFYHRYHRYRR